MATETDTMELRRLLESLPQELYDKIYDETFTAPVAIRWAAPEYSSGRYMLNKPRLMNVDRASRKKYAGSYYRNTTFAFGSCCKASEWFQYQPCSVFQYIGIFHVVCERAEAWTSTTKADVMNVVRICLHDSGWVSMVDKFDVHTKEEWLKFTKGKRMLKESEV